MKNIEELKKQQQEELVRAVMENDLEAELDCKELEVSTYSLERSSISKKEYRLGHELLTYEQAGLVLTNLERTSDFVNYNGKLVSYEMQLHRYPTQSTTGLEITYCHNDHIISFKVGVKDNEDKWLGELFMNAQRELEESEISAFGIQKNNRNYNYRKFFPYKTWCKGEVKKYKGGRDSQMSLWVHEMVAERLISAYNESIGNY